MNKPLTSKEVQPNSLEEFWMPFTANRQFKKNPRLIVGAEGMYYTSHDGRRVIDGTAGLWCVNAGHGRQQIIDAVSAQMRDLDFAPTFQMGHTIIFEAATRPAQFTPNGMDRIFFCNSGSEAVDSALKIALAYHRARGEGARTRLIGRERGYHGVGFGGISVGGMVANRKVFGPLLAGTDHIRHTHLPDKNAFSRGQPKHGAELADDLERLCQLHDPSTIAAVIVEPMAGSTGVLVPPVGYLERLREICDRHGILLIFDEVICGFGRLGASFAAEFFNVKPDLMTIAKGVTNASVPMGGVIARNEIYETFMQGDEGMIELFHGYTYSGHPIAAAAAIATFEIYKDEKLFARAAELAPYWEERLHSLADLPHVIDIRNIGLVGAIELAPSEAGPGKRAFEAFVKGYEAGALMRVTGDIIALSPPLIIDKAQIDELFETVAGVLKTLN